MQSVANWAILDSFDSTSLRNLGITPSYELRLRWFKILWNTKKKLYNFHALSFERYGPNQGWNRAWSCCTCTVDVQEHSLACNSNTWIWFGLFLEVSRSGARKVQLENTTFLVILGLCFIFNIFFLSSQIWILLFRIFLGDFVGLGNEELTCKRGRRNQIGTYMPLSPLFSNFLLRVFIMALHG